jgi:hypothetical protein
LSAGEGAMSQFNVGQVVTCILRHAASGDYKIVAAMPDRDGDHMYRIKSPLEEHERVEESLLVKSEGYLPEEVSKPSSRRRSITLPTLQVERPVIFSWALPRSSDFEQERR